MTHAADTNQTPVDSRDATSWSGVGAFLLSIAWTALGAVIAMALTWWVIVPTMGPGNVGRLAALGAHIDAGAHPDVVLLGTSVTVESVDAATVADELPGEQVVENWAINGCAISEARLIMPKVLSARPRFVVLNLLPNDLGPPDDLVVEKAYGYALGGFTAHWPDGDPKAVYPGISDRTVDAMRSGPIAQAMHFRSTPLDWLNREARLVVRSGLRRPPMDDWVAPYEMTGSIAGIQLDRHVDAAEAAINSRINAEGEENAGPRAIRAIAQTIVDGGAVAVVCIAPQHPRLRDRTEATLERLRALGAELEAMPNTVFYDASTLLSADQFADAVHPNAVGRDMFSRQIGARIARIELSEGAE